MSILMENSLQNLAARVNELFERKLLSVAEVAADLGVDRSTVYNYRNGKYPVSAEFLAVAATRIEELNLRWLLLGTGNMLSVNVETVENDPISAMQAALDVLREQAGRK